MSSKAEAAFNKAFNRVDAKAKAKLQSELKKAKALRDRANAIETAARAAESVAFKEAMAAGRSAQYDAERK